MQLVERYRKRTIWLHWLMAAAALVLALTGLFLWFWGGAAEGGASRVIHRVAAAVFVLAPLLYLLANPKTTLSFVMEAFKWGKEDLEWVKAAPDYYFGGPEEKMPPQEHINTGQKMWWAIALASGVLFVITGIAMWFFPPPASWAVILHDIAFIASASMFLVHVYLSAVHPRMSESMRSMLTGKISEEYAKSHYGKWYDRVAKGKK